MFALLKAACKAPARAAVALMSIAVLSACDGVALPGAVGGSGPSVGAGQPVQVALLVPRGSGAAGDAQLSQSLENAARLASQDLNGAQVDLRVYDTAGNAGTASAAAQRAVAEGAKVIIGPVYAEAANAAGVAVASSGVSVLSFSNNTTIAGGNVFVLGATFENTARRLLAFAAGQGKRRIVLVSSNDLPGQLASRAVQGAAARAGVSIVGNVSHEFSQPGVIAAAPRVAEAVRTGQADAIFLTANSAGALPLFAQLLPEQGVSPSVTQYVGLSRWDIPQQTLDLPGLQGGWFALPDPGTAAQFASRYQAAYGAAPHPIAGLAYDAVAAVGALAARGGNLGPQALTRGSGFQGTSGIFRLLPDGTNERALAVATVRDRRAQIIDPAPRSFGGFGF